MISDVIVVGGGVVGAALAVGMAREGASVIVLDGDDRDLRAARANFGLVWVQSKGHDMPDYGQWTRRSAALWPKFAGRLAAETGLDLKLRQTGGLSFCLGDDAFAAKSDQLHRLHNQQPATAGIRMVGRSELERMLPGVRLGSDVAGASYSPEDGECDPLMLLRSMHQAFVQAGGTIRHGTQASAINRSAGMFTVTTNAGVFRAPRVVMAAGHGSAVLAPMVGLAAPMRPQRGQILVTNRLAPFLPFAGDTIRQTADGTVMIGATHEDVGFDVATTPEAGAALARDAIRIFPDLARATMVRTWAGLRVLTPDGAPLYAESDTHPGASLITCHSGVTLAAVHADILGPALLGGTLAELQEIAAFGPSRFRKASDVPVAA
jgi:glycine/D-amino acid oxidase-like deaminating enzyme